MNMEALSRELERAQKDFVEQDAICKDYEKRIAKAEKLDSEDEERAKSVSRKLARASYKYGITEGKIRSSETYFSFIHEESNTTYAAKKVVLTRTCNLMT